MTNRIDAKPVLVPVSPDISIGVTDIKDLKILILIFALGSLANLLKWVWGFFSNKDEDRDKKIDEMKDVQSETLNAIKELRIYVGQLRDGQLSESEIRNLIRDEANYAEKLAKRRS